MKHIKQIISLLLLCAMLLTGCNVSSKAPEDAAGTDGASVNSDVVRIVVSKLANTAAVILAGHLQSILQEEWGMEVPVVTDAETEGARDILFGNTVRQASLTATAKLLDDADFLIEFSANGGVIAGKSEYALESALQIIINLYRNGDYSNMQTLSYQDALENPRTQPVSHFALSEQSGTEIIDSVTGKKAKLVNATVEEGLYGNGMYLDDSVDGYMDLGTGYYAKLLEGSSAITFNMWIMPYQNRSARLFSFYCDKNKTFLHCTYKEGSLSFYARSIYNDAILGGSYTYSADHSGFVYGTNALLNTQENTNSGIWQMLTFVVDYKADKVSFYVNGKQQKPNTESGNKFSNETLTVGSPVLSDVIGADPNVSDFGFCGLIDEISFYNCKLSNREIKTLAHARTDTNSPICDETLIRAIVEKLGSDAALALDTNLYCSNGKQCLLDPDDYSKKSEWKGGKWYVPAAFVTSYFGTDIVERCVSENGAYALDVLCNVAGKKLLISEDCGVAIISTKIDWNATDDSLYLNRLYSLMTEFSYDLPKTNTEQSRVVVAEADGTNIRNCFGPYIFCDGDTVYAMMDNRKRTTYIYTSIDGGKNFELLTTIPLLAGGSLFELKGVFYILGTTGSGNAQIGITKSTDKGKTWSAITTIPYDVNIKYCIPSTVLHVNGRVYKAYEGFQSYNWTEDKRAYVISAPDDVDLLDPNVWMISTSYSYEIGDLMCAVEKPFYTDKAYVEEGCLVIAPDGSIRDVIRIDCFPHYGNAVTMKVSEDGTTITYDKNDPLALIDLPTGADMFHIEYDEVSGYYISLINIKTTDYRPFQRNVLSLAVSRDLSNWEVVTNLLVDRTMMNEYVSMMMHAFQYVHFAFDGDDLVYLVREAMDDSDNYHDNNYLTFFRLEDFRSLLP